MSALHPNPLNSMEDRLAICAGAVEFERKVVANLREQLAKYEQVELPEPHIWEAKLGKVVPYEDYDALRAHAAKVTVERDEANERAEKIMEKLGAVLRDNGFNDRDVAVIRSEVTAALAVAQGEMK